MRHCTVISRRVSYDRHVLVFLRSAQVIRMLGLGSRKALALDTNNTSSHNFFLAAGTPSLALPIQTVIFMVNTLLVRG